MYMKYDGISAENTLSQWNNLVIRWTLYIYIIYTILDTMIMHCREYMLVCVYLLNHVCICLHS